ncbi:MAG TPA: HAD family phosphatase [Candidatus Acidoferrales bacterium]|nr:HAD family phosphatase [Candidatus Acidoferrales bacterium]
MNSPEKIAAFFDLDGTLVPPPSLEWRFVGYLLARDKIGCADVARWAGGFARSLLRDPRAATIANKLYLAGLPESLAADWEDSLLPDSLKLLAGGVERLEWHLAQGHRTFFVSGTLECLAHAAARRLPWPAEVRATTLEVRDGRWTGRLRGDHMSGEAKARTIRNLAAQFGVSLWDSYAYGNSVSDLPMLDSVGHPVAVNPSSRLRRIARSEGLQICDWAEPVNPIPAAPRGTLSPGEAR